MQRARYSESLPAPHLADYVLCFWEFVLDGGAAPAVHHVLPDGCVLIAFGRRAGAGWLSLVGPSLDGLRVPATPGEPVWGVRFWPHGAGSLLGLEPASIRSQHLFLADVRPALASSLMERLGACASAREAAEAFGDVLASRLDGAPAVDAVVRAAVEALTRDQGKTPVRDLARRLALSERQLQRRFGRAVGLTPKQFARIRRLRSSASHAIGPDPVPWSRVAAEQGYADQAHLVREFSQLVGQSPTAFRSHARRIHHVDVRP